ncbi:MAG: PRC-barrel domain-containing protein [Armatimonadota bacterium]
MGTAGELSGLAVVSEGSGDKLGKVQDVLFDAPSGSVTAFLVHPGGMFTKPLLLPILAVRTVGADALLVEQGHVLEAIASDPPLPGSLSVKSLDGRPVLDDTGKYLGKMTDVTLTADSLSVADLQYSGGVIDSMLHGKPTIPLAVVKAIGPDSIVVPASYGAPQEAAEVESTQAPS